MRKDDKRKGAYIALQPGIRELLDSICGLRGVTRTEYINTLIEESLVKTYNAMPNRDSVLEAQQTIAQTDPPLPFIYNKLNKRVNGIINPNIEPDDDVAEEEETY